MSRHLHAVPDEPVATCRHADGRHGKCGGPSNGRECWDHVQVGRLPCCLAGTCTIKPLFSLDGLPGHVFEALAFGEPWNGWATPIVTREVLEQILAALEVPDSLREDGTTIVIGDSRGIPSDDDVRLVPLDGDAYDLGLLGWTFVLTDPASE